MPRARWLGATGRPRSPSLFQINSGPFLRDRVRSRFLRRCTLSESFSSWAFTAVAERPRPSSAAIFAVGHFWAMVLSFSTSSAVQRRKLVIAVPPPVFVPMLKIGKIGKVPTSSDGVSHKGRIQSLRFALFYSERIPTFPLFDLVCGGSQVMAGLPGGLGV